jgi:hypothetical protein
LKKGFPIYNNCFLIFTCAQEYAAKADPATQADIQKAIIAFRDANEHLAITAEYLAPVSAHGECSNKITDIL